MTDDVMVSVQCITYNHEKYIRKALDGFVMQKTNFKFEVIVHDDASTDGTARIVQGYAEKYDFIIPILQSENQYSKGVNFQEKYIYPLMRGKYIAFCEGDDYWTDPYKLQTLYDYMSTHDECSMCCHAYENIIANTEKSIGEVHTLHSDGDIIMEKAIKYDNPTQVASQMFKRECIIYKPALFENRGVGDYMLLLYAATLGELHYIDKVMTRHRVASDGSWTNRVRKNKTLRTKHNDSMIEFLKDFDNYTSEKYHEYVLDKIEDYQFDSIMINRDYREIISHKKFRDVSTKRALLVKIGVVFPVLINHILDKHDYS